MLFRSKVESDSTPKLSGNLNLSGYNVYNGNVQATIYGYDFRITMNLVNALVFTNQVSIDLGPINGSSVVDLDMGTFTQNPSNIVDFGYFSTIY